MDHQIEFLIQNNNNKIKHVETKKREIKNTNKLQRKANINNFLFVKLENQINLL